MLGSPMGESDVWTIDIKVDDTQKNKWPVFKGVSIEHYWGFLVCREKDCWQPSPNHLLPSDPPSGGQ